MRQVSLDSPIVRRILNFFRIIAKISLAALIGVICLCIGVWVFLQMYGQKILTGEIERLQARTGLEITVGYLDVTFLPLPALALSDARIKGKDFELTLPWSFARPAFLPLVKGRFLPAELSFLRPRFIVEADAAKIDHWFAGLDGQTGGSGNADWREFFDPDCRIRVSQLDVRIGSPALGLFVSNLSGDVEMDSGEFLSGYVAMGRIGLRDASGPKFVLRRPRISGKVDLLDFRKAVNDVDFHAGVRIPDYFADGVVQLSYNSANGKDFASFSLSGDLLLEGRREGASLAGSLEYDRGKNMFRLYRSGWKIGADSGTLLADINLAEGREFSVTGDFTARRLSLTQWFGFARNLAPGLQLSLDNVYKVNLEFSLNSSGLDVPSINASCNGSAFTGNGGIRSFAEPVVYLNLETDKANLVFALEESAGISPTPPSYGYAPLTPMPGKPVREGELNIGYDINIAAKKLLYGPLTMANAFLRIYPGKLDKDGLEDVLLDATADFYGGKMKGSCVLGAPASLPMTIEGTVSGINGSALAKDLSYWPFTGGVFQANAKVSSEGKELGTFLANLRGNVKASGAKAALGAFPLERLESGCALKGGALSGAKVIFDGDWSGSAQTREAAASATLAGKIHFGSAGADFRNLRWQGNVKLQKEVGALPAGLSLKGSGRCGLNMAKNEIALDDSVFETDGLALKGNLAINYNKMAVQGKVATTRLDAAALLSRFGLGGFNLATEFRPVFAEANISGEPDRLKFTNLRLKTGSDSIAGSLEYRGGQSRPDFTFDLGLGKIVIPKTSGKPSGARNWDLSFLQGFNARGTMSLKTLEGWQGSLHNLRVPLRLENGVVTVSDASGSFYGGTVTLGARADCVGGGGLEVRASGRGINLTQAGKDQKLEIALGGTGFFNVNLRTKGKTSASLVENLDGNCDFMASNGFWQSLDKADKPKGKPTQFSKIQASARVLKGRFTTDDFMLSGPTLNLDGKGYLNLVKKDLDYTLNVNMKGMPDFPLYIYGPFDKPKTRVGAGRMVLNALGSVASGLGNMFGSIGEGFAKLFR